MGSQAGAGAKKGGLGVVGVLPSLGLAPGLLEPALTLCRWSIQKGDIIRPRTLDSSPTWTQGPCHLDGQASSPGGNRPEKARDHPPTDRAETLLKFLLKGILALAIGTAWAPGDPALTTLGTQRSLPWAAPCPATASPSPP